MLFLLSIFCLLILYINIHNIKRNSLLKKIPGPIALPLLGNLLTFNVPIEKQWNVVRKLTHDYYPTLIVWLGPFHPVVSIRHPEDLEILLSSQKNIGKGRTYNYLHPWLKCGLLTSTGAKWRHRRKILTAAFHFNILKQYVEIANENGNKISENLKLKNKETVENLMPLCSKYTLNIILESTMGVALDKIDKERGEDYKNAVYQQGNILLYRVPRPYIQDWMMHSFWKLGRLHNQSLKILLDFTSKVVTERREYHNLTENKYLEGFTTDETESDVDDVYGSNGRKKRLAMLDLLLSAEKDGLIDNEGIMEEVDTFTFEGHDTTAMAMTFTLMLLAENKEAQDKARAEVTEILNRTQGKIGMQELQEFNYLERCIKESLRLYPPVATMSRSITHDLQLRNYLVTAGTEVIFHSYDVHRDPNFWDEPNKFDPDRFLPEHKHGRHPFAYIPFSAGPRNCIGQKFAIMELKSLLSCILYNFILEPIDRISEMELLLDIIIRPANPVHMKFVKIDR